MRKIFTTLKSVVAVALIAAMTLAASCSYDDSAIKERVSNVEKDLAALTERVAALEKKLQSEVDALKALIDGQVVVVDVVTDAEGNQTIKLSDGKEITVLAPVECTHECTPCDCDPLQYRVIDGVLEVSADGDSWVAVNGVAAECVVANIVISEDGNSATITLANGEEFTVVKAELIEFEQTRSQVYVIAGLTKEVPFSINDAVVDINVMNQPFGWSATVEEAVAEEENGGNAGIMPLAAGGKNYVLKINGPSQELVNAGYAAKEGVVSVHFNTAAGACKVANVAVNLAEITMTVDADGNLRIVNTMAYEQENYWGEKFVDFADFFIGIMPKSLYDEHGADALLNDFQDWDYTTAAVTQRSTGLWNVADLQTYEEGVYEEEIIEIHVDRLAQAFYPTYNFEIGSEYVIFISLESELKNYYEIPVLDNAIMVNYKKVLVSAEYVADSATWNDATFNFSLAGYDNYLIGWMPVAEANDYINNGMAASIEELLPLYINGYGLMSSGAILAGSYIDQDIKLSELAELSLMGWAPEVAADTEYHFYVYPFNATTEMEFYQHTLVAENLRYIGTFSTAALVAGDFAVDATYEVVEHVEDNIEVNVTVAEGLDTIVYTWFEQSYSDPEEAVYFVLNDVYAEKVTETSFTASKYGYYGLPNPIYLAIVAINAEGQYVYVEKQFEYIEPEPVALVSFEYKGRHLNLDDNPETSGGDHVYIATAADGTVYTIGLYYTYADENGVIAEGEYDYCANYFDAMYSYWNGFVIVADEYYSGSSLIVDAETITLKVKGVGKYVYDRTAQGGGDEQGIVLTMSEVDAANGYGDMMIYLSNEDVLVALNFYKCTTSNFLPEGTYEVRGGDGAIYTADYSYITFSDGTSGSLWGGSVTVSEVDGKYRFDLDVTYGDANTPFQAVYEGAVDGLILPSEYVAPEPETIVVSPISRAKYANNTYLQLWSEDGRYCAVYYLYGIVDSNKGYLPAGEYTIGTDYPGIYAYGYSKLYDYEAGAYTHQFDAGGVMKVSEVDGAYHIEFNGTLNEGTASMEYVFDGAIENLILPSEYVEPVALEFTPVRAEYDFTYDLYEYNGGDSEYAYWLYDANNNYIEVICHYNPNTGWDYVFEGKLVVNGETYQLTKISTQQPSNYNCAEGEKYFAIGEAKFSNNTVYSYTGQLPAVEVNYLGEGSNYAPGSENQGGNEGGNEGGDEPVVPGETTELTITSHGFGYTGSMETEVIFMEATPGVQHIIDFRMTGIEAGSYTDADGSIIIGYSLYMAGSSDYNGGVALSSANATIVDNGDTTFTFDVNFVADGAAYHFTYTTPAQEVTEDVTTVQLVSKSAGEQIGSYAYGCLLSDAEGNNQVKIAVDQFYSWDSATDFPKANDYATWQSSPSFITQGSHFSFVNKTLKVNGVTYANDEVSNAKLTVVEATSITIEFTVGGADYKFVYSAF